MKCFKSFFVLLAITASSSYALAEGGGDRTYARMEQTRQVSLAAYQADQQDKSQEVASDSKTAVTETHSHC
jgi:hypothetical protein